MALQGEAQRLVEEWTQLLNASEEDLTQGVSKVDGYLCVLCASALNAAFSA
jgi:hypothetical protein